MTGCSTGIGEATVLHLDRRGHRVFAGVRKQADADRLADQASDRVVPVLLDVTDEAQIAEAVGAVEAKVDERGLGGLVNNAGVARGGPLEHLPIDEWRQQLDVNVVGQVALTKALLPAIRKGNGRVVFIGSIGGRLGNALMGPYNASKFAIEGIAQALRHELSPWDIPVSVVEPGAVKTAIWEKGRETAERLWDDLPPVAREQYSDQADQLLAGIDDAERRGVEPVVVARTVEHALTARRPRHRYPVGIDARAGAALGRLLPDRAGHWLVGQVAGRMRG